LTTALAAHPSSFPPIFVNMVRAGEASGSLDIVLDRLADFREKQEVLKGRLRAALVYPLFMAVIGMAILCILLTYIVPNIVQVFNEMERVLPLPTSHRRGCGLYQPICANSRWSADVEYRPTALPLSRIGGPQCHSCQGFLDPR
jgi:Type II secretion system (T2SS), protein F